MPKLLMMLTDTNETVVRPASLDVVRQVMQDTNLFAEKIFYPGSEAVTYQPGSSINPDPALKDPRFATYNQVEVTVTEEYEPSRALNSATFRPDNQFLFLDDHLDILLRPIYSNIDVTVEISFRGEDQNTVTKWRDEVKQRMSAMNRLVLLHTCTYSYFLPNPFEAILKQLYTMREAVQGFGDTYDQYFTHHATNKIGFATDLAGKAQVRKMSESQIRVQGYFDFEVGPPRAEKQNGNDTWVVSFAYRYKYDKPIACVFFYPLMVHNQLVPQNMRPSKQDRPYELNHQLRSYSFSVKALQQFEVTRKLDYRELNQGMQVPDFDEFVPNYIPPYTARLITFMVTIGQTNPTLLLNLNELGDGYHFDPDILAFLQTEYPYLTTPFESPFCVTLYSGLDKVDSNPITIDSSLNVNSNAVLNYRRVHHVRISLLKRLDLLSQDAQSRLRNHCAAALKIFNALDPELKFKHQLPACMINDYLSRVAFQNTIDLINRRHANVLDQAWFMTVQSLLLQSKSEDIEA